MSSLVEQARGYLHSGQLQRGVHVLRESLEGDPHNEDAHVLLMAAAFDLGDFDTAQSSCQHILGQRQADLRQSVATGQPLYRDKDLAYLTRFHCAHFFAGRVAQAREQTNLALSHYVMAVALDPTRELPWRTFYALAQSAGRLEAFHRPADIVLATGGLFVPNGFHGHSLRERALGGSESALIYLARAWAHAGQRVVVYCPCDRPGEYDGVCYRPNHEFFVANRLAPPRLLVASRHDMYLRAPVRADTKLLWAHDIPTIETYRHLQQELPQFDTLATLSRYHQTRWLEYLAAAPSNVYLTTNGFDPALYPSVEIPRRWQLIYTSRPERGLAVCLQVFRQLRADFPDLELAVCIYTPHPTPLERDPELAPLRDELQQPGVRFLGGLPKDQLAQELRTSQLLLYPNVTEAETSCIAAIEAMAAGCPVVTSDRGALPETAPHNIGGLIVPYTDHTERLVNTLTAAAKSLLAQPAQLTALRERARTHAHRTYSWNAVAAAWLQHFAL